MPTHVPTDLLSKDGSIDTDRAIEAGRDERTQAIKETAAAIRNWINSLRSELVMGQRSQGFR